MHIEPKTPPAGRIVQREDGAWQMKLLPGEISFQPLPNAGLRQQYQCN